MVVVLKLVPTVHRANSNQRQTVFLVQSVHRVRLSSPEVPKSLDSGKHARMVNFRFLEPKEPTPLVSLVCRDFFRPTVLVRNVQVVRRVGLPVVMVPKFVHPVPSVRWPLTNDKVPVLLVQLGNSRKQVRLVPFVQLVVFPMLVVRLVVPAVQPVQWPMSAVQLVVPPVL